MVTLTDLGFKKGSIAETIVSTYNQDGSMNAAPMGANFEDERHLTISIYNSSKTLANIKTTRCGVVNLTDNIDVYYRTALKEANPSGLLPEEWFEKAQAVNAPKLRLADATVEVIRADLVRASAEKTRVTFGVKRVWGEKCYPQVYCRAFGLTLEAIIHATRVKVLGGSQKEQAHVNELLRKIRDCDMLVARIAPNSSYTAVMADLLKRIDA